MTGRHAIILAAMCLTLVHASAKTMDGAGPPNTVDLPAVLRLVRDASPRLAAEREEIAQAEAERITAGAYPNPTLSYNRAVPGGGVSGTQFTGIRQEQTTVELPLLFPGQYSARIGKAEREIEAARARVASGATSLAAEAGSAYIALLAAQEKAALLTGATEELARFRQVVAGRQSSGVASQYDLARMDVEAAGFSSREAEARADVAEASGKLAALLGLKNWRPRASGNLSPQLLAAAIPARPALDLAMDSPAVVAATREQDAAQASVTVARRERWPNVSVVLGRSWTTNPFGASDFFGLSVELPIFDTRRGPLAKAESEARAATLRKELATAEAASGLDSLANAIASRQSALKRFEDDAASRLPALRQMAEDNYRLRGGSILELLDATRSRFDLENTRIDLVANLVESQLNFLAISGNLESSIGQPAAEGVKR